MIKYFFSISKIHFILYFLNINSQGSKIEELIRVNLYSEEQKKNNYKNQIHYAYCHNKFCKKISFYYTIFINEKNKQLNFLILLINNDDEEQEILDNTKELKTLFQWHCHINTIPKKLFPKTIKKKTINQNDIILFGKNHIGFGNLYEIIFDIKDIEIKDILTFNINQNNTNFSICFKK